MALAFPLLGEELLPNFREYDSLMHSVEKPGASGIGGPAFKVDGPIAAARAPAGLIA